MTTGKRRTADVRATFASVAGAALDNVRICIRAFFRASSLQVQVSFRRWLRVISLCCGIWSLSGHSGLGQAGRPAQTMPFLPLFEDFGWCLRECLRIAITPVPWRPLSRAPGRDKLNSGCLGRSEAQPGSALALGARGREVRIFCFDYSFQCIQKMGFGMPRKLPEKGTFPTGA